MVATISNYYPFGMLQAGRNFGAENTRVGFQGQEGDSEIKGQGNSWNYKYRMHDSRIGRFLSIDPITAAFPHNSPYAFSENDVIRAIELEGAEKRVIVHEKVGGTYRSKFDDKPSANGLIQQIATQITGGSDKGTLAIVSYGLHVESVNEGFLPKTNTYVDFVFAYKYKEGNEIITQKGTFSILADQLTHTGPQDIPLVVVSELIILKIAKTFVPVVKSLAVTNKIKTVVARSFNEVLEQSSLVKETNKSLIKETTGSAAEAFQGIIKEAGGSVDDIISKDGVKIFKSGDDTFTLRGSKTGPPTISRTVAGSSKQTKIRFETE